MSMAADVHHPRSEDPVSKVLKWTLLAVAVSTFALFAWATVATYQAAPPQPDRFVASNGGVLMTGDDILAGKAEASRVPDLMDYGSLYGMGSYYGEDYTASTLVRLATATQNSAAVTRYGKPFSSSSPENQAASAAAMRAQLQGIDLSKPEVIVPDALAAAIGAVRSETAKALSQVNAVEGWTPAYSLNAQAALETADFIIYSALTTVARRPGLTWSWTENWPYEPIVGNTPTTNTFLWTWISFCLTFFAFGAVLFIYKLFLSEADDASMDPVLREFHALTPSQRKVGEVFPCRCRAASPTRHRRRNDHGALVL